MVQRYNRSPLAALPVLMVLLLVFSDQARAQEARSINVGRLLYQTNETLGGDNMLWPRNMPDDSDDGDDRRDMLNTYGVIIGVQETWTDNSGVTRPIRITQIAQNKFSDIEVVTPPVSGAFKRTYRHPYPSKVIDGQEWTDVQAAGDPVSGSAPADVVIYNHLNTWSGIDIERYAYGFSSDDHDDYVILEHIFTNTTGQTKNDVYFGLIAGPHQNAYYPADIWADYYGATYARFKETGIGDDMRLYYAWDAEQTSASPFDTRGKPQSQYGQFREAQYMGYQVLHADTSPTDEADNAAFPWKAGWSQRELAPDLNVAGHEEIYNYLCNSDLTAVNCLKPGTSNGWDKANPGAYAVTVDANGDIVADNSGPYRILDPALNPDINNRDDVDPLTEQEKTVLFSFGPFTLEPGQDYRVVTAFVGGTIPYRWAIDAGRAYNNGETQRSQFGVNPLPYNLPNASYPFSNDDDVIAANSGVVASAGATLDKATKNAVLDLSKVMLFANARKLRDLWERSNVKAGAGSFDLTLPPASPSLTVLGEPGKVTLSWNSVSGASEYRIYREFTRPTALALPTDTTFLLHATVPGGTTSYVDEAVVVGEQYYYYVTAVDGAGNESSAFLNRTGTTSEKFLEAAVPKRAPADDWQENVVVVPNPFHIQGADNYETTRRLTFLNLPGFCNIHIYTMTGDLIQTIEHMTGTGDDAWERQDTFSTMEIVSGIYLYVVEELDAGGSSTGNQSIGKFVVIK